MEQIIEAVVDDAGHIQIPENFHEELGLSPGKKWRVERQQGGELSLQPLTEAAPLEYENGILVFNGKVDEEVAKNWLAIVNSNRERPLFCTEADETL
jgi:bifunctional DNA-binding transcriptional regulator/antitoxin component of YhaV-PrlF toxin-antitoxin module